MRFKILLTLAAAMAAAGGQLIPIRPPLVGIAQNVGQAGPEVLLSTPSRNVRMPAK